MVRHDFVCETCRYIERDQMMPSDPAQWVPPMHCGAPMDWFPNAELPVQVFEAFSTRNIRPDGEPMMIRGKDDLAFAAREYGVRHYNDPDVVAVGGEIRKKSRGAGVMIDMGRRR